MVVGQDSIGFPFMKIRWSHNRLIFIMWILNPVKSNYKVNIFSFHTAGVTDVSHVPNISFLAAWYHYFSYIEFLLIWPQATPSRVQTIIRKDLKTSAQLYGPAMINLEKYAFGLCLKMICSHYLIGIVIPFINMRQSSDRLRFIIGIPTPVRWHPFSE